MDTYTQNRIQGLQEKINKAQNELNYLVAFSRLQEIADNTVEKYVDYLAAHYKEETYKPFEYAMGGSSLGTLHQVEVAIRKFKSKSDTKKNPSWAAEAKKLAAIIDNYKED